MLATPARLSADLAVLVHPGVPLALISTRPTSGCARFKLRPGRRPIRLSLSRQEPSGGIAHVSTVQVEADATDEHLEVLLLSKASIGAGRTRLGTVAAGLDALAEQGLVDLRLARMGLEHLGDVGHDRSPLGAECPAASHEVRDVEEAVQRSESSVDGLLAEHLQDSLQIAT